MEIFIVLLLLMLGLKLLFVIFSVIMVITFSPVIFIFAITFGIVALLIGLIGGIFLMLFKLVLIPFFILAFIFNPFCWA